MATAVRIGSVVLNQHRGMATVAEAPAAAGVNGEGALMVSPMNGAVCTQSLPAFYSIAQIIERQEMDYFARPGCLRGDGHTSTCLPSQSTIRMARARIFQPMRRLRNGHDVSGRRVTASETTTSPPSSGQGASQAYPRHRRP